MEVSVWLFILARAGSALIGKRYLILAFMAYWYGQLIWLTRWDMVQLYLSRGHGSADELLVSRVSVHSFLAGIADRMIFSTGAVDTRQVRLF